MVKVLNNMIQGKGKVIAVAITIALVTGSSLPVILSTINFFMKIAIITVIVAVAAIATYLGLSIPSFIKKFRAEKNDVSAKTEEQPDASEDEGYKSESEDEDKEKGSEISAEEQEEIEFQVQEDLANARERERMERGWLGGSINALGEPINSEPSMDLCSQLPSKPVNKIPEVVMLSLPEHMDLYGNPLPDQVIYTENSHLVFESQKPKQDSYVPMKSLPDNMNVLDNSLSTDQPSTDISIEPQHNMNVLDNSLSTEQPSTDISIEPQHKRNLFPAQELLSKLQKENNENFKRQHENFTRKALANQRSPLSSFQH